MRWDLLWVRLKWEARRFGAELVECYKTMGQIVMYAAFVVFATAVALSPIVLAGVTGVPLLAGLVFVSFPVMMVVAFRVMGP